ncbi:MAG: serine hydrolase domain-containing protein [Ilumatobacteraceae bacterium]
MGEIEGQVEEGSGRSPARSAPALHQARRTRRRSLYVDGECKVDLWGGVADQRTGTPWTDDTLELVFSTTKGIAATAVAMCVQAGTLAYDDPVSKHWPEFAAAGKGDITVEQALSHQAGLIGVDAPLDFDQIMAVTPVIKSLQEQTPL